MPPEVANLNRRFEANLSPEALYFRKARMFRFSAEKENWISMAGGRVEATKEDNTSNE